MRAARRPPRRMSRHECRLKYCTARSCFSAASRVSNVPRFRRRFVRGSILREYSRYLPDLSLRIMRANLATDALTSASKTPLYASRQSPERGYKISRLRANKQVPYRHCSCHPAARGQAPPSRKRFHRPEAAIRPAPERYGDCGWMR